MGGEITEAEQIIAHEHSNGEIYVAESVEGAQKICPVLGEMSLEQAGLLLELETIGKKVLNEVEQRPKVGKIEKIEASKPVKIERVQKVVTVVEADTVVSRITTEERPTIKETIRVTEPAIIVEDIHLEDILRQEIEQPEQAEIVEDTAQFFQLEIANLPEPTKTAAEEVAPAEQTRLKPEEIIVEPETVTADAERVITTEVSEPVIGESEEAAEDQTVIFSDELPAPVFDIESTSLIPEIIETVEPSVEPLFQTTESLPVEEEIFQKEVIETFSEALATLEIEEPVLSEVIHEHLDTAVKRIQEVKDSVVVIVEADEAEITDMFVEIFESLDLDYSHEEIVKFVRLVLKSETAEIDSREKLVLVNNALGDLGTHEGLMYLLSIKKSLKSILTSLHAVLGRLVLMNPQPSLN